VEAFFLDGGRNAAMREPDLWTNCAEALELSVEGNRLIAHQVARLVGTLWRRMTNAFDGLPRGLRQQQQLPPT